MPQIPLWVILLLVLVPVSGFIAWFGDRVGHKVGKRRHTLFGLRPRHTATLFTIGAGVGISLLSLLLIWVCSAELRTVLSEGTRLVALNRDLKDQNGRLETDIAAMRQTIREAHAEAKAAEKARDTAQAAAEAATLADRKARKDLLAARTQLTGARRDLTSAKAQVAAAESRLQQAQSQIAAAREQLGTTRARLAEAEKGLAQASENLAQARTQYKQALKQVAVADTKRTEAEELAQKASRAALRAQDEAEEVTRTAQNVIAEQGKNLLAQRTQFAKETAEQRSQLKALADEVADLQEVKRSTLEALGYRISREAALRRSPITYRVGEEVDRMALPAGISIWRIQAGLEDLMVAAARKAQTRGAAPASGTRRAVFIPEVRVPESGPTEGGAKGQGDGFRVAATEADALRAAAEAVRSANQDTVIVLTAVNNAVAGEPVEVELKTYRNPVVLRSGEKIGELTLDGIATRQQAADTLYAFLRGEVRKRLLDAGVIPPAEGATGATDDDETGSIVSLSGEEWLRVMDGIRRAGPRSRVIVRAATDLRAADPVRLAFEVKSIPLPPPDTSPAAVGRVGMPGANFR